MAKDKLGMIRGFFDTSGTRLRSDDKDILCKVIENASDYNGYTSDLFVEENEGKDYKGRWSSSTEGQYRINIDEDTNDFSVDHRVRHSCDDGYVNDSHWDWEHAWNIDDAKGVADALRQMNI